MGYINSIQRKEKIGNYSPSYFTQKINDMWKSLRIRNIYKETLDEVLN